MDLVTASSMVSHTCEGWHTVHSGWVSYCVCSMFLPFAWNHRVSTSGAGRERESQSVILKTWGDLSRAAARMPYTTVLVLDTKWEQELSVH